MELTWAYPEDVSPGAPVGVAFAWHPHSDVERSGDWTWNETMAPPRPPGDYLLGEWRPSPCFQGGVPQLNFKLLRGTKGLFDEGAFVKFYVGDIEYLIAMGTPSIIFPLREGPSEVPDRER